ncbi:uncharacterized protein LOC112561285 isoform X2 [Pomacea canaliculata]|uniref:uncharacterized protein LOC112561285 isoform X2 n=1 Tax=Pomacea canaliculata TaxID=400727 RepID=UPI000D72CF96|nr:uncharacterized protein LOC112561285 isoform X2 [Pomacea canaliculata]
MEATSPRVVKKAGGRQPPHLDMDLRSFSPCFSSNNGEHHRGRRPVHRHWLRCQTHQTSRIVVRTVPGVCGVYRYVTKLVEAPEPSPYPTPTTITPARRQYTGDSAESPQGVVVTRCHLVGDEKSGDISDAEGPRRCRGAESRDRPSRQTLSADVKSSLKAASPDYARVRSAGRSSLVFWQDDWAPSPESSRAVGLGSVPRPLCSLQPLRMTSSAFCDFRVEADSVLKRISVFDEDQYCPTIHKPGAQTLLEEKFDPLHSLFSGERSTEEENNLGILDSKNIGTGLKYTYQQLCCRGTYSVNEQVFLQPRNNLLSYESQQHQVPWLLTGHRYHSQQSNSRTIHKLLSDLSIIHLGQLNNVPKPQGRLRMPPHLPKVSEPFKSEVKTEAVDGMIKFRCRHRKWSYHGKLTWTFARKYRAAKHLFLLNTNHPYIHKTKYTKEQEKDKKHITWGVTKRENVIESVHISEESELFQQWGPYKSPLIRKSATVVPTPAAGPGCLNVTSLKHRQTQRETVKIVDGGCDANRLGGRTKCMCVRFHQASGHRSVTATDSAEVDSCGVGNESADASENDVQDGEESFWDMELQLWKDNIHAASSYWQPGTTYQRKQVQKRRTNVKEAKLLGLENVRSFHGFVQDIFIAVRSKIRRIKGVQSKK